MATDRPLVNYLPLFVQDYVEMQKIMSSEQPEIDAIDSSLLNVWNDQFILDATVNGVSRWENMLDITPKATDTLSERKFRILTRLNQELPYTMTKLNEVLTTLCGEGGFSITLSANIYKIVIKLALTNVNNYSDVQKALEKMLPANMIQQIEIMYNTHEVLHDFTHTQLHAYTHTQLRNEVLS